MPRKKKAKEILLDKLTVKSDRNAILIRFTDSYYENQVEMLDRITGDAIRITLGLPRWDSIKKELNTKENYKSAAEFLREVATSLEKGKTLCSKNKMGRLKKIESLRLLHNDGDEKKITNNIKDRLFYLRP